MTPAQSPHAYREDEREVVGVAVRKRHDSLIFMIRCGMVICLRRSHTESNGSASGATCRDDRKEEEAWKYRYFTGNSMSPVREQMMLMEGME